MVQLKIRRPQKYYGLLARSWCSLKVLSEASSPSLKVNVRNIYQVQIQVLLAT